MSQIDSLALFFKDVNSFDTTMIYENEDSLLLVEYFLKDGSSKKETFYKNGVKQCDVYDFEKGYTGLVKEWYKSGNKKAKYYYKNGFPSGEQFTWYESGEVLDYSNYKENWISVSHEFYKNGNTKSHSIQNPMSSFYLAYYCENGQIRSENYSNLDTIIDYITYYCNGNVELETKTDGLFYIGKAKFYNEDGILIIDGYYSSEKDAYGVEDGIWNYYKEGKVVKTEIWDKGILVEEKNLK